VSNVCWPPLWFLFRLSFLGLRVIKAEHFVIIEDVDGVLAPANLGMFMQHLRDFIQEELHLRIVSASRHPFGIEIFDLGSLYQKHGLIAGNLHDVEGIMIHFISHDRVKNFRSISYERKCWILMLGFPLDFMHNFYIHQVVSSFGRLIRWHNSRNIKSYVLVPCMYHSVQEVSHNIYALLVIRCPVMGDLGLF
jgi:hypothetical protein